MEARTSSINVAIVDDQNLFRDAIVFRINNLAALVRLLVTVIGIVCPPTM